VNNFRAPPYSVAPPVLTVRDAQPARLEVLQVNEFGMRRA